MLRAGDRATLRHIAACDDLPRDMVSQPVLAGMRIDFHQRQAAMCVARPRANSRDEPEFSNRPAT
jgi:hypothetical protein